MPDNNASPEEIIASLQATITANQGVIAEKDQALEVLQAKFDALTSDFNTLTTTDSQRVSDLAEATKIIGGQKAQIDAHEATIATLQGVKPDTLTVTVDGKVYAITAGSALVAREGTSDEHRTVTAQEIIEDTKLAAALVKKGVGFLELIKDSKKSK